MKMDAYTSFSAVYDMFMDNIPYRAWSDYLVSLLEAHGVSDGLVLELGCGTGSLTELLDDRGYDMIGVDNSEDMLQIAVEKRERSGKDILYLLQDMREFELYGTVGAVVSICDSMNYILEYKELVEVLRLVNNYLEPGGVFIFDLNTEYKYREILGQSTIAEDRDESSFIWENNYDEEDRINEYDLTLFIRSDRGRIETGKDGGGLYRKYKETHYQRAYSLDEVRRAVGEAGMEMAAVYDAFTKSEPRGNSERIYVIAGEKGKERKS